MDFLAPQQIMAKNMGTLSDPAKYIVWLLTFVHTTDIKSYFVSFRQITWWSGLVVWIIDMWGSLYERDCYLGVALESQSTQSKPAIYTQVN